MDAITLLHARYMTYDVRQLRYILAIAVIVFSVMDLCLTQTVLSSNSGHGESNPFMAHVVMSWWAWPLRVGVPAIVVARDLRKGNHDLLLFATCLYGMVVLNNLNAFMRWNVI